MAAHGAVLTPLHRYGNFAIEATRMGLSQYSRSLKFFTIRQPSQWRRAVVTPNPEAKPNVAAHPAVEERKARAKRGDSSSAHGKEAQKKPPAWPKSQRGQASFARAFGAAMQSGAGAEAPTLGSSPAGNSGGWQVRAEGGGWMAHESQGNRRSRFSLIHGISGTPSRTSWINNGICPQESSVRYGLCGRFYCSSRLGSVSDQAVEKRSGDATFLINLPCEPCCMLKSASAIACRIPG